MRKSRKIYCPVRDRTPNEKGVDIASTPFGLRIQRAATQVNGVASEVSSTGAVKPSSVNGSLVSFAASVLR